MIFPENLITLTIHIGRLSEYVQDRRALRRAKRERPPEDEDDDAITGREESSASEAA